MSALQDRPRMKFYKIEFRRKKPDVSKICFVVGIEEDKAFEHLRALHPIFEHKFPGWTFGYASISESNFERRIQEAQETSLIDFDHRHPNDLFETIKNVCGNFFDPWRFT